MEDNHRHSSSSENSDCELESYPIGATTNTVRDITKEQKERQNVEIAIFEHHDNPGGGGACFIDASSLLDEDEIATPPAVPVPPERTRHFSCSSSSSECSLNNLSDEEKLLKMEIKKTFNEVKDQFTAEMPLEFKKFTPPPPIPTGRQSSVSEKERKQGELIFKNNIQQFSSHLMNLNPSEIYDSRPQTHPQTRKFGNSSEKTSNSCFIPDTPHNSIVQVIDSPKLFRKSKCDESSPIISGGTTKFESSSSSIDEIQQDISSTSSSKNSKSAHQSWIVDMSNCGRPRSSSTSGNESISSIERKSNPNMAFYVSLLDVDTSPKSLDSTINFQNFRNQQKKSTEFYIDFSDTSREGTPRMSRKKNVFQNPVVPEDKVVLRNESVPKTEVEENIDKRHTWSNDSAIDSGIMKILDKIPLISKVSSSTSLDDSTYTKSNHHFGGTTYDKSSVDSLTDGLLLSSSSIKISSSSTDDTATDDVTFQDDDATKSPLHPQQPQNFNRFPGIIMETIIESKESSNSPSKTNGKLHTMETLQATIEKQIQLLDTVTENSPSTTGTFVKLSDMDKPQTPSKFELHSPETLVMSKSVGNHRQINRIFFDSRSSRTHSWAMTRSTGNNIINITSSVDNLRSLSRLFPHLSKEFSNSLPNNIPFGSQNGGEITTPSYCGGQSDISIDSSSLTSSFSRSAMDESSISCRQPRRLGEDLLKMFIQELATDIAIEVNGRLIKAHKCILRSRCQYFAAMLAGDWIDNSGNRNILSLPGFSYSSVHFALCHIYSGASHPPEGISLMELAALADLLGLEGLKEVTSHALRINYCHNFHKPCSGCIDGILQVLPVALNHALDDLYRKCLKWTCKHYMKVWPTRNFAQLPEDIFKRCRQQIVAHMTSETVLDSILDCDSLLTQLAIYRWALVIENSVRDILDAAYNYVAEHFANVIASDFFLSLGHDKSKYITHLENVVLHTATTLCPDQACRSYQRITRLNAVLSAKVLNFPSPSDLNLTNGSANTNEESKSLLEQHDWNEDFIRLVSAVLSAVEQCLIRQCSRAMRVVSWQRMDVDLRKKIQTLARLNEPMDFRHNNRPTESRGKPVTKAFSFGGTSSRTQSLNQVKLAMQASKKTTHTQTNETDRIFQIGSTSNRNLTTASNRNKQPPIPLSTKITSYKRTQYEEQPKIKPTTKLSNVPPRYLQPRKISTQTNNKPEIKKVVKNETKIGNKSTTISLDSLTISPYKTSAKNRTDFEEKDICTDSLAVSTRSSMISDRIASQESLNRGSITTTYKKLEKSASTSACKPKTSIVAKKHMVNERISYNSSSSSVTNRSSSRFSSSNSVNSPLYAFKNRSISVPGPTDKKHEKSSPTSTSSNVSAAASKRKSFLSAKSREILAKREERNKLKSVQQEKVEQPVICGSEPAKTNNRNYNIGKSWSVSNIPTRKNTNILKNLKVSTMTKTNAITNTNYKIPSQNKKIIKEKEGMEDCERDEDIMSISKLERSSTFCKDSSDLPVNELQIID